MPWHKGDVPETLNRIVFDAENEVYLNKSSHLTGDMGIGRFTYIAENSILGAYSPIRIGSFCSIAANFRCITHEQHPTCFPTTSPLKEILGMETAHGSVVGLNHDKEVVAAKPVSIGDDVWIGDSVKVFGGVTIGTGCVIGARSLVTKDCEPYGIYAGTPARLIRKRFPQPIIDQLLELRWWDWPVAKIKMNLAFFETDLTTFTGELRSLIREPASLAA